MGNRRANPNVVKRHRSYTVAELAECLGTHKNSVRQWQRDGLKPIDDGRPMLFRGVDVEAFLRSRNARRKVSCPPGTLYCFRCRAARQPAGAMADYIAFNATSGNIRAICGTCETMMHRRARLAALPAVLPGIEVQIVQAQRCLSGQSTPSLNCDLERQV